MMYGDVGRRLLPGDTITRQQAGRVQSRENAIARILSGSSPAKAASVSVGPNPGFAMRRRRWWGPGRKDLGSFEFFCQCDPIRRVVWDVQELEVLTCDHCGSVYFFTFNTGIGGALASLTE